MRQVCGKAIAVMVLAAILGLPGLAGGAQFDYSKFNQELGLRFAYGKADQGAAVRFYTLLPRWGIFFLRPGKSLGGLGISFVLEGIVSVAEADENGFELGFTPMVKFTLPLFRSLLFYVEGGAGMIAESFNSPAIAHTFNFTPQFGGGFDIALQPQLALSLAYRFRHSSNAGIYERNPSFNVHFFQMGISYYY